MHPNFVYLNWDNKTRHRNLDFRDDKYSTVSVRTSVGVYKNNYTDFIM